MTVRCLYLGGSLLGLFALGCDGSRSVEPTIQAVSTATSGPTINAPSTTKAIAISESRIDLSWQDNSSNETGFEVYRSTTGGSAVFALWVTVGAGVTSYSNVAGLNPSTEYCYKVRALRTAGNKTSYSTFSATDACATTPPPPIPLAPSLVDARAGGSNSITLQWMDNSTNESGFRVERSTDGEASWTNVVITNADTRSIWDLERTPEQLACYRVFAFNSLGASPASNTDCTAPLVGPTNLIATLVPSTGEIDLTWTDNSMAEDGYDVFANDGFDHVRIASLPANSTAYHTWYATSFVVHARQDGALSDPSNYATVDCLGQDCPLSCGFDPCPAGYVCSGTLCVPHCGDGVQNGDEIDVDCGGSCGGCQVGQTCWIHADCASGNCFYGICQP
jgi:hypothetical protein